LMRASSTFSSSLNSDIFENNLTPAQFGILEALFHLGPLSQKSLGQKVLSTKGNITTIVDNLEKQSLVIRVVDTHDRRSVIVELTKMGQALMGRIFPNHVKKITQLMSILTTDETKELKRLCKKLGLSIQSTHLN
jgi:MarR family transcriptional regulator, 2-MHQ and catechol-resistance regulon repressor